MYKNKQVYSQLIELINCSLWKKVPNEKLFVSCEWDELFTLAKEQTVLGLALSSKSLLPKELQPTMKTSLKWLTLLLKIEKQNQKMNKAVVAISKLYKSMEITPLIMKGQVIAQLYPEPNYRHSGDIDVCFRTHEEAQKAYQWARESKECRCLPLVNEKEQPFSWHGIMIENHERIADMAYKPYQNALQEILEKELQFSDPRIVSINGELVETLSPTLTIFHLIIHLQYHILNEGVGLRQFCDLAIASKNIAGVDQQKLTTWLKDCGLERIAASIGWILHRDLGLDKSSIPWNLIPDCMEQEEVITGADTIIEDVWTGGNFGKKKWDFKGKTGFFTQKIKAFPLHWVQYRKYRSLLPHEAWANFLLKFRRAAHGIK